jgi:hypothetical protein
MRNLTSWSRSAAASVFGALWALTFTACAEHAAPVVPVTFASSQQSTSMSRATRRASWMSPDAKEKTLIYVSSSDNDVYVYDYKTGTAEGMLTGFDNPWGECVDSKGDVWIANFTHGYYATQSTVVEYAHGGTMPINSVTTDGSSFGCAVDPTTGDLAVADFFSGQNPGDLLVFPNASGAPNRYTSPTFQVLFPPAYDNQGNLYVEGGTAGKNNSGGLDVLAQGGTALNTVSLPFTIGYPAGAFWDGKYIGVTDQNFNDSYKTEIYQVTVSGTSGTEESAAALDGCSVDTDVLQPFISIGKHHSTVLVGANLDCSTVDYWRYPKGGKPKTSLSARPPHPQGVAVSLP